MSGQMIRPVIQIVALGALLASCGDGGDSSPTEVAADSIKASAIRAHIEFLADDLLEGREAGTRGHDLAAGYAASAFSRMGLKPAGADGSYFQPVRFLASRHVEGSEDAVILRDGSATPLTYRDDYLTGGGYGEANETVTAPLAFVGFGISAPELDYDDFEGVELTGKIAVVLSGAPSRFDTDSRAFYSSGTGKLTRLTENGAVGVIFVTTPVDEKRRPWARRLSGAGATGFRWLDADGAPFHAFTNLKAGVQLSPAGAAKLFDGAPQSLDEVFASAEASTANSFDLGYQARLSRSSAQSELSSSNVAAMIEGSDPVLKDEYVVLSAHLDHFGIRPSSADNEDGDTINNGAYDNATGSAIVLEVARAFSNLSEPPKRSVIFLLVTAEEKGLLGSEYFAKYPTVPVENLIADVNIDMPVIPFPIADLVIYGAEHSSLGRNIARAAADENLSLSPDPAPERVRFIRSDQFSFIKEGIPSIKINPGIKSADPEIDGEALVNAFLKDNYHQPSDQTDLPWSGFSAVKLARTGFRASLDIANDDARPLWNAGDFFGTRFGPDRTAPSDGAPE